MVLSGQWSLKGCREAKNCHFWYENLAPDERRRAARDSISRVTNGVRLAERLPPMWSSSSSEQTRTLRRATEVTFSPSSHRSL